MGIHIEELIISRLRKILGDKYRIRNSYAMFAYDEYVLHPKSWWFFRRWISSPLTLDLALTYKGGIWIEAKKKFLEEAKAIAPIIQNEFNVGHVFVEEV